MATNNCDNLKNAGLQSLTSAGAFNGRTITGTASQVAVTNGNGTGGNPTLAFPATIQLSTQPCFLARVSSASIANVTGDGTAYTVIFDTSVFDQNSNYNSSTGIFTAPVTGIYQIQTVVSISGLLVGHTQCNLTISNISVNDYIVSAGALFPIKSSDGNNSIVNEIIVNLTASATVSIILTVSNGTKVISVLGSNAFSWFSGSLLF